MPESTSVPVPLSVSARLFWLLPLLYLNRKRKREIELIADKDRAYFKKKWGFGVEEMAEGLRTLPFNFTDGQPYDIGFKVAQ